MNRLDFHKSLYEFEQKNGFDSNESLKTPLTVIAIVGAGILFFIREYEFCGFDINFYIFLLIGGLTTISFLCSIFVFVWIYALSFKKDREYRFIDKSDEIEDRFTYLLQRNTPEIAQLELEKYLTRKYAICCGKNSRINEQKFHTFLIGKRFLVFSIFGLILTCIPFIINFINIKYQIKLL